METGIGEEEEQHGIPKSLANTIFDACAKFAEYGFNKSHSAPYGYITYQTAYLKTHYFQEFMAAKYPQVGSAIRSEKQVSKDVDGTLRRAIEEFKKTTAL